jgi:hypothetical protein
MRIFRQVPTTLCVWLNLGALLVMSLGMAGRALSEETAHSFIGFGKANGVVFVDESGAVKWQLDIPASDGWVLPSGNILIAAYPHAAFPNGGVIEIEPESKRRVFEYQGQQKEISTAIALPDGKYLVAELGPEPRAVVVNADGKIEKTTALQCQVGNTHMQTRMLRVLSSGNYLAPHLLDFAVKEYDADGKVVNTFMTDDRGRELRDWPFTAIRLGNGNTLIGCTNGNRVIEVDTTGKIVWSVSNGDLGEKLIDDACGVQRLPNGNTVIASYRASGESVKLLEVSPDKKVVWKYSGMKSGFHHFQILTTNGAKLSNITLK